MLFQIRCLLLFVACFVYIDLYYSQCAVCGVCYVVCVCVALYVVRCSLCVVLCVVCVVLCVVCGFVVRYEFCVSRLVR